MEQACQGPGAGTYIGKQMAGGMQPLNGAAPIGGAFPGGL